MERLERCKTLLAQMILESNGRGDSAAKINRLESDCRRLTEELNDCRANLEQDEEIFREKIKELKDTKKHNNALRKELQQLRESRPMLATTTGLSPEQELQLKELRSELHRKELQIKDLTEQQLAQSQQLMQFQKQVKELEAEVNMARHCTHRWLSSIKSNTFEIPAEGGWPRVEQAKQA
jgi:DNA repair exonuclease SbcCD ATPase subunit